MKNEENVIRQTLENPEIALKLNKYLEQKKYSENIIPLDEATAFLVYLGLTEATFGYIKGFTDKKGLHFLPTYKDVKKERDKCVAKGLKVTDTKATASVKDTTDNYLDRLLEDPDVREKVEQVEEEYGKENVTLELIIKLGYDGSTQHIYKVCYVYIYISLYMK